MPQNNNHFGAGVPSIKSATGRSKESAPTTQPAMAKLGSLASIFRSIGAKVGRTASYNSKPAATAQHANSVAALDARGGKTTAPVLVTVKSRLTMLSAANQKAREVADDSTPAPKRIGRPPGSKNKFKTVRTKEGLLASSAQAAAQAAGGAIAASAADRATNTLPPSTAKPASVNLRTQKGDGAAAVIMQKAESAQKAGDSESSEVGSEVCAVPAEAASHAEEGGKESAGGTTATTEVVKSGLAAESGHTMSTGRMRAAEMGAQSSWEGEP